MNFETLKNTTQSINIISVTLYKNTSLISDEDAKLALEILMCGVTPMISLMGLVGNIFSIKILLRDGLHKSSNILLFVLAVADAGFLVGFNSLPKVLYTIEGNGRFLYSYTVSFFMFVIYLFCLFLDYGVGFVALTIPMFITCERFVAVFFPLKFPTIVTPPRIWAALIGLFLYRLIYMTYSLFWFEFHYIFDESWNRSAGLIGRSEMYYADQPKIQVLEIIGFSVQIPPLFTLLGCLLIIIRLKYISKKRRKLTQSASEKANMKTTQMLLAVCSFYIVACSAVSLPSYLPKEWIDYNMTSEKPSNLGKILYQVINILLCINSSWNFVLYVALNKKFRDIFFREIIAGCFKRKK